MSWASLAELGLLLTLACGAPERAHADVSPAVLVVASDLDNMPFAGVDSRGLPVGRDVEMMAALAQRIGRSLRWKTMPFSALLPAVQAGDVDVVCATVGITAERDQSVDFSDPYYTTAIEVVVRKGPGEPRRWADLDGRLVGADKDTTSERAVRRVLPRALGVFDDEERRSAYELLISGALDGLAMDGPNAAELVARHGDELTLLLTPLAPERYALVLREGDATLRRALDGALTVLRRNGTLERLNESWGL